jgi:LPXTG-site transpeptidase (sortase) family protein
MHYSSRFEKPPKKYKPDWLFTFTSLAVILYLLISQWPVLSAYYETWIQHLPQRQVLEGISEEEIGLDKAQPAAQGATSEQLALLPSYSEQEQGIPNDSQQPIVIPTPTSITQPVQTLQLKEEAPLIPDLLRIPAIQVEAAVTPLEPERVQSGNNWQTIWPVPPAEKAGWHSTSATAGVAGNTVINGHNYPQEAIFRSLYKLEPGDQIMLYAQNRAFEYVVVEILILPEQGQPLKIRQANAQYIQATKDERLTLVTCHPYASLANRLIVIAVPAKNLTSKVY